MGNQLQAQWQARHMATRARTLATRARTLVAVGTQALSLVAAGANPNLANPNLANPNLDAPPWEKGSNGTAPVGTGKVQIGAA